MDAVTQTPGAHAKPAARHDHLWVLFTIAACVLAEVWASWVGIGSISGFPRIDGVPTDWVLAVAMEAYWGYALYAWLVASPGPRSRAMAMWSCAVVFLMSLTGQILYHELTAAPSTPPGRRVVIAFSTSLPVIVLALIAVLIHLRHADRAEADQVAEAAELAERQAAIERAEADERTTLRADLSALREELEAAQTARQVAEDEAAETLRRAEKLAAKLATVSDQKPRKKPAGENAQGDDVTTELRALMELKADPDLTKPRMGGELARRLGVSSATGRRLHGRLAAGVAAELAAGERSPTQPDARYGERS
jgi:hypothetical protein